MRLDPDDIGDQNNRRQKKRRERAEMVKNSAIVADWKLKDSESWDKVFREKTAEGPILSLSCRPCLKYHVKGVCYDDCKNRDSHKSLAGHDKDKTDKFIKSLRGN